MNLLYCFLICSILKHISNIKHCRSKSGYKLGVQSKVFYDYEKQKDSFKAVLFLFNKNLDFKKGGCEKRVLNCYFCKIGF